MRGRSSFYGLFGLIFAGAFTAGLEFNDIGGWWDEPILYQKLMIWTILLEVLGLAATCGPLAFHFDPPIGGVLYWWQTDTLRVPPYPNHVPLTKGARRTPWDTGLYKLIIFWLVMMLFLSGNDVPGLPEGSAGVMPQWALVVYAGLIVLMGMRDKIIFLSARSEQYVPTMLAFGLMTNFVDMIVAAKIFIVVIWMGAGFSKFNHGFSSTVSIMVQNTPWVVWDKFRKATVKDYPNDIRPSRTTHLLAHVGGTTCELVMPLVLLFAPWHWMTWIAIVSIWMLHTFIISTFPLAVPLEWNVFFMFCAAFLFGNFHASDGYGVQDMNPGLLAIVVVAALFPIVLGALRPQYVSFLVGMKQYAGNWAAATFSLRNKEIEDRINQKIVKAADNQIDQIEPLFGKEISEIFIQKAVAFRMMHPMGRMHISGLMCHVDSLDNRIQTGGRVPQQRAHRLELRRRALPRRAVDRSLAGSLSVRARRCHCRLHRVATGLQQEGAVPGDRCRARLRREGLVSQRRCLQHPTVAARRTDPAHRDMAEGRLRTAGSCPSRGCPRRAFHRQGRFMAHSKVRCPLTNGWIDGDG